MWLKMSWKICVKICVENVKICVENIVEITWCTAGKQVVGNMLWQICCGKYVAANMSRKICGVNN